MIKALKSQTLSSGKYYETLRKKDGAYKLTEAGKEAFLRDDSIQNKNPGGGGSAGGGGKGH